MRSILHFTLAAAIALATATTCYAATQAGKASSRRSAPPQAQLIGGYKSIDELVDAFLERLAENDRAGLELLRLSESEYRTIVLPGSVPVGHAPRDFPEQTSQYYWELMDTKSRYFLADIVGRWGGKTLKRQAIKFRKGKRTYAWYKAHEKLSIKVLDANGEEAEVSTGSVVEFRRRFKFVSFVGG
jgi:hypothetical protein